ncbi:hypothetical protein FO519_000278 [Halicephalobus sp. NKZ332]|nr:hypothetical protein FO519_000278 [Halicephalobus sp. NKZ332]
MFRFCLLFLSYSLLVHCRRLFFLFPDETVKTFQYSKTEYGHIVSAYAACYMVSKLVLGSLNDVFSPSKLLSLSITAVGLVLLGLSVSSSVIELYLLVPLTALFQGGAWLSTVKFLKQNYPSDKFPILFTILGCTNNFSGILAPLVNVGSWRNLTFFWGAGSLAFSILVYFALNNSSKSPDQKSPAQSRSFEFKKIFFSPTIWKIGVFMLMAILVRALFEMWIPVFLTNSKDSSKDSSTDFQQSTAIFEVGGAVGGLVAGILVQYAQKYFDKDESRWTIGCLSSGIMLISATSVFSSDECCKIGSFFAGATVYACINIYGMISADSAPYHMCAAASAFVSFLSNIGPIVAGSPLAMLIEKFGFVVLPVFLQILTAVFVSLIFITKNIPLHLVEKID